MLKKRKENNMKHAKNNNNRNPFMENIIKLAISLYSAAAF